MKFTFYLLFKELLIFVLFFLFFSLQGFAAQVELSWDQNDPEPEGYRIFLREDFEDYDYNSIAWEGSGTTCTITELDDNKTYHFVVRAYACSNESEDSNEITFVGNEEDDVDYGCFIEAINY